MPLKKWKQLDSKVISDNGYWSYRLDKFEIEGGVKGDYHYVHTGGSTMCIPIDQHGNILLINQYRYLNQRESLEFPCGAVSQGLTVEENAIKELREETGFTANQLDQIGEFSPYTGASDEITTLFIATKLQESPLPSDPTEQIEVLKFSFEEIEDMVEKNIIWDGLTLAAWSIGKNKIKNFL